MKFSLFICLATFFLFSSKNINAQNKTENDEALQTYSKYDFIAGEKVIFFNDFSESAVGDYPANWNTNASGEVVTTNRFPGKWFTIKGEGATALEDKLQLPDNYTIEFDVFMNPPSDNSDSYQFGFYLYSAGNVKDLNEGGAIPGLGSGIKVAFGYRSEYSAYDAGSYTNEGTNENAKMDVGKKYHLAFWIQKTRLRIYLDQVKIFDLPKIMDFEKKINMVRFETWENYEPSITNFRIATGLPDIRSKLITDGKLVSYGIYFDVNRDVVKPESYGTLKGIADVLNENPAVKIKIVGYTDADGDGASNLDLSKRRANAVKNELAKTFGIDVSRMQTDGMGETKPVAANDTPSNKALNRRVEFIKL